MDSTLNNPVGISQMGVAIPRHFILVEELAAARGMDPHRAAKGLGVLEARIPYEISVAELAAEAVRQLDYQDVKRFYFATESDGDAAKPTIAVKIARELGLGHNVLLFQGKFACLAGVQALLLACEHVALIGEPAIVAMTDRSVYNDETDPAAEVTLGCGAIALRIDVEPKIAIDFQRVGAHIEDIDDFRVPAASFPFPDLNGPLSTVAYDYCVRKAYEDWKAKNYSGELTKNLLNRFHLIFHVPFPKMVEWAAAALWSWEQSGREPLDVETYLSDPSRLEQEREALRQVRRSLAFETFYEERVLPYLKYNRRTGNDYTAALFISLIAAAEGALGPVLFCGYGSGAGSLVGELNVIERIATDLAEQLNGGEQISVAQYEEWKKSLRA